MDVERKTSASNARFKHGVVGSQPESCDEKSCVFAPDGLGSAHHAFAQLRQAGRQAKELFLPNHHSTTNRHLAEGLQWIKNAQALDFLLPIDEFHGVIFAVFIDQNSPFLGGHERSYEALDVKVRPGSIFGVLRRM